MTAPASLLRPATTTAPDWSAWTRGSSNVRGAEFPAQAAEARLRYNDVGTYIAESAFSPALWLAVGRGTRLELRRNRAPLINGPIVERELRVDAEHPGGLIIVTGESDEGLLADRLCWPNPSAAFLAQTNGARYTITGPAETVIKTLVNLNAGPGARVERRVAGLTVETDQGRGAVTTQVLRYDNLLTVIGAVARDAGLAFRIDADQVFRVTTPPDLSATVRYSLALGNLNGLAYRESAPTATVSGAEGNTPEVPEQKNSGGTITQPYVAPQPYRYEEATSNPASAEYGRRVETWTDGGDSITGVTDLIKPVRDTLAAGAAPVALPLNPSPDYVLDADPATVLGAKVTVQVGPVGFTSTAQVVDIVRELKLVYERADGTDTVTPTIGTSGAASDVLAPQLGGLDRRLSLLERR